MFDIKELTTAETGGFSGEAALNSMQNALLSTLLSGLLMIYTHNIAM